MKEIVLTLKKINQYLYAHIEMIKSKGKMFF